MRSKILHVLLLALVMTSVFAFHEDHGDGTKCTHDDHEHPEPEILDIDEEFQVTDEQTEGRNLAASYPKIRMYAYYGMLSTASESFRTYMQNELGPAALAYFKGALRVKYPVTGTLKLPASVKSVCNVPTPSILTTGVAADYAIIFDSAVGTTSWVAESYACYLAAGTKRPLVAKALLNTNLFKAPGNDVLLHEKNIYLLLHEMTHTLGFASGLYKYFLTDTGQTRTGHILSKSTDLGTATVINVPAITNRIRKFFGCSTIAGAYGKYWKFCHCWISFRKKNVSLRSHDFGPYLSTIILRIHSRYARVNWLVCS